ncbi:MAG: RHS repeat-associated core domain-containing protein, partial [Chloroflexota bacterium]
NARYYVPGVGRFASADALVPDPQNPQSFNRYGYVLNNPLRFTDPTGHRACEEDDYCAPSPKPVRPVELKYWEKQLLAIAAFAEMHGHGNAQAEAIVWVTLNRVAGTTTPEGASFSPNSNFSATSHVAGYVLSSGQYAIGQVIMEEYGLLKMGANKNFQPIEGMTVGEVVDQAYDNLNSYYEGGVDDIYKEVVIPVISDYEAGGTDPTGGSIFFGHVTPAQAVTNEAYLRNYAESLGVSSQVVFNRFPSSQVDRTGTPVNYLVVNNLIALPQVK